MTLALDRDQAAILRVIEEETAAYFNKDYEAWARCWVHAPYARRYGWYARGGRLMNIGWEQESAEMKLSMETYPHPNASAREVRRENVSIEVRGDVAWATFEQIAPHTGDAFDVPGRQFEMRILERGRDQWLIVCCFILGSSVEFVTSPLIEVNERSVVLWMNKAASEQIRNHESLQISGGRLFSRNRLSDQRLQASIRWAAGLKAYTARQMALAGPPAKYGAVPVLLGDESNLMICWVIAEDRKILVSFNDKATTNQRLEAAAVVYGLAPAQMRLARLIVDGLNLVESANRLGITPNTARTHLKRMYAKTGVSSQATLVRVLLSAASPVA